MSNLTMKGKKGTVIHRTTSETLRLGDDILSNHSQVRAQTTSRKKSQVTSPSCSFQITGVSLTRYDVGDDSADDLDESHTDDISRVTDNETPSFSEDSRDNDDQPQQIVHTAASAVSLSAPKIETDSKRKEKEVRDVGLGRFKVVKIESVAPFSRGRWTCFDYLDQAEKSSFVFCKNIGNDSQELLDSAKPRTCNSTSFIDTKKYLEADDIQKRIPNTSAFWETNCQESYLYSGAIIVPNNNTLFPLQLVRPQKNRTKTSCQTIPNTIPMVRPAIKPSRSVFTSPTLDTAIKNTQSDKETPTNSRPSKTDVGVEKPQNVCREVAVDDTNKNIGASVSCTATIDTKIEHALDVVKNHLTHAVRLEVEELKIKINELVDRISYLEYENDLLRANVAPDVLANLENSGRK